MERSITGTMVEYYFVCKRKLYYFAKDLTMEQENESVLLGKVWMKTVMKERKNILQSMG